MKNKRLRTKAIFDFLGTVIVILIILFTILILFFVINKVIISRLSSNEENGFDRKTFDKVHEIDYSVSSDFTSFYNDKQSSHTYYNDEKGGIFCWFRFEKYDKK